MKSFIYGAGLAIGAFLLAATPGFAADDDSDAPVPMAAPSAPAEESPAPQPSAALTLAKPDFAAIPDGARLTLDLPADTRFEVRSDRRAWQVRIPGWQPPTGLPGYKDPVMGALQARADGDATVLSLPWRYRCSVDVAPGPTLAFTFKSRYRDVESEKLAPGVVHDHVRQADPARGPLDLHVLRVDPRQPGVRVMPALAGGDAMFARNTVSWIAAKRGALAGVNGTYFSEKTGEPLGLVMLDGRQVTSPLYDRAALGIGAKGEVFIGNTQLTTRISLATGESYDVDGVNQPRGLNRLVLYTAYFGASTHTLSGGREFVLGPDGTVTGLYNFDSAIPAGGCVLSAQGQAADWLAGRLKVGTHVTLTSPLADYWPGVRHVLAGGPLLLQGGQIALDPAREHFRADIAQGASPRTAVGVTADGQVLIVTADGRDPWESRGLTLAGLANLMRELGAVDALNFDGGGSTAMAVGGRVVNQPSDGRERAVNNALLVFFTVEDSHVR